MVNDRGLTQISKELNASVISVCIRLQKRNLTHSRLPGSPETTFQSGSKHKMAKLNETQVLEIVSLSKQGLTQKAIAQKYGVTRSAIGVILQGRRWSHITGIKNPNE
jgi:hypothetical protein